MLWPFVVDEKIRAAVQQRLLKIIDTLQQELRTERPHFGLSCSSGARFSIYHIVGGHESVIPAVQRHNVMASLAVCDSCRHYGVVCKPQIIAEPQDGAWHVEMSSLHDAALADSPAKQLCCSQMVEIAGFSEVFILLPCFAPRQSHNRTFASPQIVGKRSPSK
jgi:hypothetical protein